MNRGYTLFLYIRIFRIESESGLVFVSCLIYCRCVSVAVTLSLTAEGCVNDRPFDAFSFCWRIVGNLQMHFTYAYDTAVALYTGLYDSLP